MATLFLDDDSGRSRAFKKLVPYKVDFVESAADCIKKLGEEEWDLVFLDHDLGGETYVDSGREDCGMEVVRWILDNQPIVRHIIVHTHNEEAGKEMVSKLKGASYKVEYIPFNSLVQRLSK